MGNSTIEVKFDERSRRLMERMTRAIEGLQVSANHSGPTEKLYYDDDTMFKVRAALIDSLGVSPKLDGLTGTDLDKMVTDLISTMQNAGILFRERTK